MIIRFFTGHSQIEFSNENYWLFNDSCLGNLKLKTFGALAAIEVLVSVFLTERTALLAVRTPTPKTLVCILLVFVTVVKYADY